MLGGAAIFRAELGVALAEGEAFWIDQKKVCFSALGRSPRFQCLAFFAQFSEGVLAQLGVVTDPDIHVALLGLGQRAEAAHQEQAVDRLRRIAVARLVGERTGQSLRFAQRLGIRFIARHPGRRAAGYVTGQQRVIDVKEQRQKRQHRLLAR